MINDFHVIGYEVSVFYNIMVTNDNKAR